MPVGSVQRNCQQSYASSARWIFLMKQKWYGENFITNRRIRLFCHMKATNFDRDKFHLVKLRRSIL